MFAQKKPPMVRKIRENRHAARFESLTASMEIKRIRDAIFNRNAHAAQVDQTIQ